MPDKINESIIRALVIKALDGSAVARAEIIQIAADLQLTDPDAVAFNERCMELITEVLDEGKALREKITLLCAGGEGH